MFNLQKYIMDSFNINETTSATIIITLFVFITGILIQQIIKGVDGYIVRYRTRNLFGIAIKSLVRVTSDYSKGFAKTANSFGFDHGYKFSFNIPTVYLLKTFENIGYKSIYDAYFSGIENWPRPNKSKALQAFNAVWEAIVSADFWQGKIAGEVSQYMDNYNRFNTDRNEAIETLRSKIQLFDIEVENGIIKDSLAAHVKELVGIFMTWANQPGDPDEISNPKNIQENLIEPMREVNRSYPNDSISLEVTPLLHLAQHHFQNTKKLLQITKEQYDYYTKLFLQISSDITTNKNILDGNAFLNRIK